jgi:hypothetical protein
MTSLQPHPQRIIHSNTFVAQVADMFEEAIADGWPQSRGQVMALKQHRTGKLLDPCW